MSLIVLLDAGPLGMITNPKSSPENEACKNWLAGLAYNGVQVLIPEIADYEVLGGEPHSSRSTVMGSMRTARRAGIQPAAAAMAQRSSATAP